MTKMIDLDNPRQKYLTKKILQMFEKGDQVSIIARDIPRPSQVKYKSYRLHPFCPDCKDKLLAVNCIIGGIYSFYCGLFIL